MITLKLEEHWRIRRAEWLLALSVLSLGIAWALHPAMFELPNFSAMRSMMSPGTWAAVALAIGLVRVSVLYVNGFWRASPHFRAVAAFLSGFLWTSLFMATLASDALGVGVAIWPLFFFFDALSAVDAAADARVSDIRAKENKLGARHHVAKFD
jgi:hypothetical protein